MLDGASEEDEVGRTETVVGIAGEDGVAVDVRAAGGGIEVEGDGVACVGG